jgi:hypothetical protein
MVCNLFTIVRMRKQAPRYVLRLVRISTPAIPANPDQGTLNDAEKILERSVISLISVIPHSHH